MVAIDNQDLYREILLCSRYGDLEDLKELLEGNDTYTEEDQLKILKSEAVDPYSGNTALHMAAANGHESIIIYLLSLQQQSNQEKQEGKEDDLFENVKNQSGNTALHYASLNGHLGAVKALLEIGKADPLVANEAGRIPFEEALMNNHKSVKDLLVSHMEKIESKNNNNNNNTDNTDRGDDGQDRINEQVENLTINH